MKEFLSELAVLLDRHDIHICATTNGTVQFYRHRDYEAVEFDSIVVAQDIRNLIDKAGR